MSDEYSGDGAGLDQAFAGGAFAFASARAGFKTPAQADDIQFCAWTLSDHSLGWIVGSEIYM